MLTSRLRIASFLLSVVVTALLALGVDQLAQPVAFGGEPRMAAQAATPAA